MFLHIGESQIVFLNDLVGIFNLDIKDKEENRQFLEFSSKAEDFKREDIEKSKSFIVTKKKVFFSPISSYALARRRKKA
ncbi:MAG: DUF370 domain-containing protein [Dethiobacteria bacterium]